MTEDELGQPPLDGATIGPAGAADAAELLVLQRCCRVDEAIANDTLDVPALHESLDACAPGSTTGRRGACASGTATATVWSGRYERAGFRLIGAPAPPTAVALGKPRATTS